MYCLSTFFIIMHGFSFLKTAVQVDGVQMSERNSLKAKATLALPSLRHLLPHIGMSTTQECQSVGLSPLSSIRVPGFKLCFNSFT